LPTTKIMVIRHAEKPNGEAGLMADGTENEAALTSTGWRRAAALIGLFDPANGHFVDPHLARPETIFASGTDHHNKSLRPQQTVTPLAKAMNLPIKTDFIKGNEGGLIQKATTIGGTVLISWQHEAIPDIAGLILGRQDSVPQRWPGYRFDLVWVFDRPSGTGNWSFVQVPQMLFASDSSAPISHNEPES
jgi:broad specificity phosphatase PhoE